ncbi:MAG: DUF4384 domain-containing protein [Gemmatimonadota bacterium]
MLAFALSLLVSPLSLSTTAQRPVDPPIRVKLSDDVLMPGEHVKVRVKAAASGYLLVLRMDGAGRVRVLYPVDPEDSVSIEGGKETEIKGRGGRETFTVDERQGKGTVFAAVASQPFHFDDFIRGGHWDYRALAADSSGDSEALLLELADRMASGHYDYDLVTYEVWGNDNTRGHSYAGWYGPRYYDPFYSPWPFFGSRYSFGFGVRFGGGHFGRHRWW